MFATQLNRRAWMAPPSIQVMKQMQNKGTHSFRLSRKAIYTALASLVAATAAQAANVTMSVQQAAGLDWNTAASWSNNQSAAATVAADPTATFELLPGSRLRSPVDSTDSTFPGSMLTVDGSGVFVNNPGATDKTTSEIRFKQNVAGGRVTFPKLVMNGGQLDTGNDGTVTISGEVDILKTTSLYNDGPNDRGYLLDAFLTGNANVEIRMYNAATFNPAYIHNVNIAGATNTFSGQWNVITGALLATGTNSLGTNNIIVGAQGALQATYDINSPNANLQVNGRVYLTGDHSFRAVTVGTTALTKGVHTFAELNAAFSQNFPDTWNALLGAEDQVTPDGSITVLEDNTTPIAITKGLPADTTVSANRSQTFTVEVTGPVLSTQWYSNNVAIPDATSLSYTTPALTTAADGAVYKVILQNSVNTAQSSTTVHIDTSTPVITLSIQQVAGSGWNTANQWSDNAPAGVSAAANPNTIYKVLPGARLRSPDAGTDDTFPGSILYIEGSGAFVNNPAAGDTTTSEIRFKQSGDGKVTFPKLVMDGGQLDTGNDGTVDIAGEVDIAKNTPIYNDATNDRGYLIEAYLTGTNNIEYHGYNSPTYNDAYSHNLNIAGNTNTFSGKWNVVVGTLLGTGTNALGTNDITIGPEGALETTYDITNTAGSLILQGRMFLHQNDTFRTVTVGTTPLARGAYTFADLSAQFPNQFPAAWTPQIGAESTVEGSGSITVLEDNSVPVALIVPPSDARVLLGQTATFTAQITGPATSIKWFKGNVEIPGATGLSYTTDPVTAADNNTTYKVVISNNVNNVQATAGLTIGQQVVTMGFLKDEIWIGTQYDKDNIQATTDTPTRTTYLPSFESQSNQADNYAEKVSGWITPTVTGDYIFFIASDDDSNLYLSPTDSPNDKVLIANEPQYNGPRAWLATTRRTAGAAENRSDIYTGSTIHLEQGKSYYIEADHHDGTGGDNLAVTFILAGAADPVDGTAPALAGMMLSANAIDGATLSIVTQPTAQSATVGGTATFTVAVNSSTTNIVYQWQKNGADIAGANSATYTTPTLASGDDADYRVLVSAPGAPLQTSAAAHLTVGGGTTPTAATIKNATISGGSIHFAFATQAGVNYTVEYKTALSDGAWTTLKSVPGTGTDATVDDVIDAGTRFYRVTAH
jgi:hypothetical protein